jgi:formamidopyrimidine-DNA glycosylase
VQPLLLRAPHSHAFTVKTMPELPEVETLRGQLAPVLEGALIRSTLSHHPRFDPTGATGAVVTGLLRRGKYLIATLDSTLELVFHHGMTGQIHWENRPERHLCCELHTSAGTLYVRDPRRFGRVVVVEPGSYDALPTLASLGPEPLDPDFDLAAAATRLATGTSPVKTRLLAQHAFAGAGNYICDESLHRAGVHPASRSITAKTATRIITEALEVMKLSLAHQGLSVRDYQHADGGKGGFAALLRCYGRAGLPCTSCSTPLVKIKLAGRGTTFCPTCQPLTPPG